MSDEDVTVKFSRQLVEQMADKWSAPVQWKMVKRRDGTYEPTFRAVPSKPAVSGSRTRAGVLTYH